MELGSILAKNGQNWGSASRFWGSGPFLGQNWAQKIGHFLDSFLRVFGHFCIKNEAKMGQNAGLGPGLGLGAK